MRALVDLYAFVKEIDLRQLFRSAYLNKYQKDIQSQLLDQDVSVFERFGTVPSYMVDYMIGIYGVH
ncbi:MAG: hypothetical protein WA082_04495 [Candidatus Moraniibacteriota bacterium]